MTPMKDLRHFIQLAKRGQGGGASGGEVRACHLAKAVLDHVPGLDQSAIRGLQFFIDVCHAKYSLAESFLHDDKEVTL